MHAVDEKPFPSETKISALFGIDSLYGHNHLTSGAGLKTGIKNPARFETSPSIY